MASEYLLDDHFLTLAKNKELLPLKERYILVEMSYRNPPIQLYDILYQLQTLGYKPVLAHPERYGFYAGELQAFQRLKKAGCAFQLNLLSTVGYYGADITKTAEMLLKEKMYDYVGSDIHHTFHVEGFYKKLKIKNSDTLKSVMQNNQFFT